MTWWWCVACVLALRQLSWAVKWVWFGVVYNQAGVCVC